MSYISQGLGSQSGIGQQSGISNLNQNGIYGSQNLIQSTSSIGYGGNIENIQNHYMPQSNNQYMQQVGAIGNSTTSYSSKNYNYGDYGNIGQNSSSAIPQTYGNYGQSNTQPSNTYLNQIYQKSSYEQMTPISQHSIQGNFAGANSNTNIQQTSSSNVYGHQIGVQQINLAPSQTAQINMTNQASSDMREKQERERQAQQIRESQQQRQVQREKAEEHDASRGQLLLFEEMRRQQLLEKEAAAQKDQQKQKNQEQANMAQLQQLEELKRLSQKERDTSASKAQRKQELEQQQQRKVMQQQQKEEEEYSEKKKRSNKQPQIQQQQQEEEYSEKKKRSNKQQVVSVSLEQQHQQQKEQEEMLHQQHQQEQEEQYSQQYELQQRQILEQQQLIEQMKQAMMNQHKMQSNRDPPSSVKRTTNKGSGSKLQKGDGAAPIDPNLEKRLEIIETSLNRVCNQHDALMPLLQLLETVPSLQRSEQQVKNLGKKYTEVEKRLKEIESSEKKDSQYQHIFSNIERNFKNTSTQISNLKKDIVALENNINAVQTVPETKLKEDTLHLYRQVDAKLARNMKDVKSLLAEFKNTVEINMKRDQIHTIQQRPVKNQRSNTQEQEGSDGEYGNHDNQGISSQVKIYTDLNNRLDTQLNNINGQLQSHQKYLSTQSNASRAQIDIDIANIYREIGMLRSEMELLINKARSEFIQEQLQNIQNPTETEKQLFIAGLEQNMFLQEIESFDHLNQQRIYDEMELLEDKLHLLNNDITQMKEKNTAYHIINEQNDEDGDRGESASQNLLIEQYRDQGTSLEYGNNKSNHNLTNLDVVGYELKFIGDRIFNYKQQIHGTKKKYLCDCRRLEDRLQTLEYLSNKAEEEGTDNQVIHQICQIDKFKQRVDSINNSIGNHVSTLTEKIKIAENIFAQTKANFKTTKGIYSSP